MPKLVGNLDIQVTPTFANPGFAGLPECANTSGIRRPIERAGKYDAAPLSDTLTGIQAILRAPRSPPERTTAAHCMGFLGPLPCAPATRVARSRTMPKSDQTPLANRERIVEHAEPSPEPPPRGFTAWHHFLSRALDGTKADGFDVQCFVRLGELPLEADVILLHLDPGADLHLFRRHFDFLVPLLRPCVVIEYKSPDDRLALPDFDTVRAYSMLCKRKYSVKLDEDVAVVMLYSHTDSDFFADCERLGHRFVEIQPGIKQSQSRLMPIYAVDLVRIGEQKPTHPINLLSARRRLYTCGATVQELGPFAVLYDEIFLREIKKMAQHNTPGNQQLLEDADRNMQAFVDRNLQGWLDRLSPEQRLRGLPVEERLRGLPAEEILHSLPPSAISRLRELLLKSEPH